MRDRVPERRRRLARKRAPRKIGDGARDHHRQPDAALLEQFFDREDRRLGVERVEDRLDQQKLGAAVDEAARLLVIGGNQIVEGNRAETGIGDIRRDRRGAVRRPERARDETAAAVFLLREHRRLAREPRAGEVQLVGDFLHAVIGLRDAGGGKGVGLDDIGARTEIMVVNVADRLRLGEVEKIVVSPHLAVPGVEARAAKRALVEPQRLDHRAHGAVEHEDALARGLAQRALDFGAVDGRKFFRHEAALISVAAGRKPRRWHVA